MNATLAPKLNLTVQFATATHAAHKTVLPRASLKRWVAAALFADSELTLRFVDASESRALNRIYRGKDYATNVLTFTYSQSEADPVVADIVICCPVIGQEALERRKSLEAHYAHMVVHGALHAQGYDHENEGEAEEMETLETGILASLNFADPYQTT